MLLGTAIALTAKPLMLIFAVMLLYSSFGMFKMIAAGEEEDEDEDLGSNRVVRWAMAERARHTRYKGTRFFARDDASGALRATPLLLVLATVELSDIVFAADSIPAVLGLSKDLTVAYHQSCAPFWAAGRFTRCRSSHPLVPLLATRGRAAARVRRREDRPRCHLRHRGLHALVAPRHRGHPGTGVLASCLVGRAPIGGSDGWSSDQGKDERVKE